MNDAFLNDLRRALNHLYDPAWLSRSALCPLFGITSPYDRATKLQRILDDAIRTLVSSSDSAVSARRRRLQQLLINRYLQQFSQKQVADELGVSVSQLAREQQAALQALAMHIWQKHDLAERWQAVYGAPSAESPASPQEARKDDLAWVAVPSPEKQADPTQVLNEALQLAQPLLAQHKTSVQVTTKNDLPLVAVYPVAMRQILLNLFSALLFSGETKRIVIETTVEDGHVILTLDQQDGRDRDRPRTQGAGREIETAKRLIELSGGKLGIVQTSNGKRFVLHLPIIGGIPVLVIDDNTDHINLLQRYTENTRYRLLTASDPERGLSMAGQTKVAAIIVDIMMPRIDGWAVLQHLRSSPATATCPILVCSVLPLSALALSLGAHAFLAKPIGQQELLLTLDRLTSQEETESH